MIWHRFFLKWSECLLHSRACLYWIFIFVMIMCEVCKVKRHVWHNLVWVSLILWLWPCRLWIRLLCWNCQSILGNLRAGGERGENNCPAPPPGVSRQHVHNERCPPVQIKNTQFPYQCRATGSGLIPHQIFETMSWTEHIMHHLNDILIFKSVIK